MWMFFVRECFGALVLALLTGAVFGLGEFLRRRGVVAKRLHAVGGVAPRATDGGDIRRENATAPDVDRKSAIARGRADHVHAVAEAHAAEDGQHLI